MAGALAGTKVIDITQGVAGPYCSMQLGDAGADVIKIEPIEGDAARGMGPPFVGGESALFLSLNRNKKSVAIDLNSQVGRDILRRLAKDTDVFVEDLGPGVADGLGLGYQAMEAMSSRVVYASITAFGEKGPLKDQPGAELVIQAMADFTGSLGAIGQPPVRLGTDVANMNTGVFAFQAILAALFHRLKTGEGQRVVTSMLGTLIHLRGIMWAALTNPDDWFGFHLDTYTKPPEHGYRTMDIPVYFNLRRGSQEDYDNLLIGFGMADCLSDPRFGNGGRDSTGTGRYAYQVKPRWEEAFKDMTCEEVIEVMKRYHAEAVPINNYDTLFAHPQFPYLDAVEEIEHPTAGKIKMTGIPWKLFDTPGEVRTAPPLLGQHTDEVLISYGYSRDEIARLRDEKVVK